MPHSRDHDEALPPLVYEALASLASAVVYTSVLRDRFELACTSRADLLDGIPQDFLLHLVAVSQAFQDGARHTLSLIDPELARRVQVTAGIARAVVD
jgi:hypothetical protein